MIFKTITDETTLSGQKIVGALQARKIAQQQATAQLEIDIACLKEYQVACQNGTVTTEQFDTIMHKASASAVEYSAKVKAGTGTAQSYANAQRATNSALQEVSIGAGIASKAVKLFSTALNMIAFTAIIQGVSWLIGKADEWIVTAKEAKESANAFKQSLSTFFNETQTNLKTISSLSDRFNELSKNVNDTGKKIGGTEEEYAEFLDICQQVGQIMPELITGYTNEGEAIITLQGKVDSLTDSYKEAIRTKAALFLSNGDEEGNSIKSFFEDYNDFVNGYQGVLGLKTSPSGQNTAEEFEEYYGYDKIHGWLTNVTDATLEDLEKLRAGTTEYVYLGRVLKEAGYEISEISADNYNAVHDVFNSRMSVMEKEITDRVTNIKTAFQNMLYADSDYWKINDENVISAINSLYASIDDEFIKQNELFSQTALQTFESDFVSLFNNDTTKQAMVDFYTPIADDETVKDYADRIKSSLETVQSYCDENGITVPINFDDSEQTINDLEAQYQRAVDFAKDKFDGYDPTAFFKEHSINTQEEIDKWQEIAQGARDAAEAEKEYLNQGREQNSTPTLSISQTIDQLNTQLKPAFDSLQSAYQDISDDGKFQLSSIDILSTCDSIKSKLDELNKIDGITVDYSAFEDFVQVLSNTESTENDVETAFDALATSISRAALSGTEDFGTMKAALEDLGVINSEIVAFGALISNTEALKEAGLDLVTVSQMEESEADAKITEFANEAVSAENLEQAISLLKIQKILCNENWINSTDDINNLLTLANAAGIASDALGQLYNLKAQYDAADNSHAKAAIAAQMEALKSTVQAEFANVQIDFGAVGGGKSASKTAKETQKEVDIMAELNSEMDKLQSAYKSLCDIRDTYNKYGKITVDQYQELTDMGFNFLANLVDENGQLGLNEQAFEALANAKLQEMQIQLARNAIDTINGIKNETEATEYLTYANENLRNAALSSTEALLYQAQAMAHLRGEQQGLAADQIVQGYEASKQLVGKVEFGFDPSEMDKAAEDAKKASEDAKQAYMDAYNGEKKLLDHMRAMDEISNSEYYERLMKLAEKYFGGKEEYRDNLWEVQEEYHDHLESIKETYNWIENLLESLSKKTNALIDKASKFISWQKKNAMINRAVKASDKEITQNQNAYQYYMKKADGVGLSRSYINKIQNGTLSVEELANEEFSEKIEKYEEWYNKAQDVLDTINDLYDQQRDLIRQKLDNVLDYYNDLDSYLSSVTSKVESLISLNEEMGKRSSLTELVEQFAKLSDQIESAPSTVTLEKTVTEVSFGDSKKVADAANRDRQALIDSIQSEIENLDADQSGTYTKLLKNIAKTEAKIDKYIDKGWDETKSKQYDKLVAKLENYYNLRDELDNWATSNTIANYNKVYTAYQKLQNKLDSGKELSKSEQKKYDSYAAQIDGLREQGASALEKLYDELAQADGSAEKQSKADKVRDKISGIQEGLENSATYQNLLRNIEKTEDKIAALDEKGYDNLTKKQKKTYDKLQAQLEAYYAKKESLDENAAASNIAEYNKIYDAWRKLQDKLDAGKNLTTGQWKKYNQYTKQLEDYAREKETTLSKLNDELAGALNPGDKLEQIEKAYEESAEGIYESYQNQLKDINGDVTSTKQYQNLLVNAQKLEQKKDTKGLSKSEQAKLDKYNAELEALRTGGMSANISDYMKTWESWYKLQQKLDNGKKLSDSQAKNYDAYKAKLEAWNNEKQTQISDLLSLMEDDLEQLQKTYVENVSEAESEINDYYSNLYSLAKQIAEYNITSLQTQLTYLESCISYYKELVSLYDSFSGDKLVKLLKDLGEVNADDAVSDRLDLYSSYLDKLQAKYDTTLSEMNEYSQLLDALDSDDFESSIELFNKAMEGYKKSGNTAMADKLQSVLDLLNERAIDADNWGEYADEWANEWEEALSSAKQELIGTATEIQEVNDALREIRFENITDAIDELEKASGILSSIATLIQDDWLFEPDGSLSEYGRAKAALLVSQLEDAQGKADEYLKLYNEIQASEDTYASDKAYKADLNEALQNYYDSLNSAASLENSIMDLMKKNAEEEINSLKDIIKARQDALRKKKEYYDYDKSIKNSQKEIDSIKAQIAALESLSDTTDAATKAKLAQLKADLAEKEEALQETKDEHTFNLQIDALDELADSLTDSLDDSIKSVEEILKEQTEIITSAKELYQTSTDSVNETLDKLTAFYSGMGVMIDGTDLDLASGETNTANGTVLRVETSVNPEKSKAVEETSGVMNRLIELSKEAFENGIPMKVPNDQLMRVSDQNMFSFMNNYVHPMVNVVTALPNYLNSGKEWNAEPMIINNHYDSLLTVNGNVDKEVLPDLNTILEKSYQHTANELYRQRMLLK